MKEQKSLYLSRLWTQIHIGLCLIVLWGITWCLDAQTPKVATLTSAERAWITAHPSIRLAPDPEFRPIEFFDEAGNYVGIGADFARLIGQKLGIQFKIVPCANWDDVIQRMQRREVDVLNAVVRSPQREAYMLFPPPYLEIPSVIIVRNRVERDLSLEMLAGMSVVMVSGYGYIDLIHNAYPTLTIELAPDLKTALRKVSFGMVDAFVGDLATASYYIEEEGITNLRVAGETEPANISGFGVRSDWPELSRILEKGITMTTTEEQQAIYRKWIRLEGAESGMSMQEFRQVMLIVAGVVTVVVGGFFLWNRALARMVHLRTEGLQQELHERKRVEQALLESEERMRQLAENIQEVFWIGSPDWQRIDYISPTYENVWGYSTADLYDQPTAWLDGVVAEDRDLIRVAILQKSHGDLSDPKFPPYRIRRSDGDIRWIQARAFPIVNAAGKVYRIAGIAEDITERKKVEEQIRMLNVELEFRVQQRTAELEAVNTELKNFAYVVSHDLKAPLRGIEHLAQWLVSDYAETFDDAGHEMMTLLVQRIHRMESLIDGILQYSRIGRVESNNETVDLAVVVPALIDSLAIPSHIAVVIETGLPTLHADLTQMTQLFQNLLSNAVNYMDKAEGHIAIRCETRDDDVWQFCIQDNGPGIDRQYHEKIFQIFQTLHARDERESTGIGLTVVKKVIELYGGRVWVESLPGQGSTFFFTLPKNATDLKNSL